MSMTLARMAARVLMELRVIDSHLAPAATDQTDVLEEYEIWRQEAERDWNIDWDADDVIPTGAERAVILLIANRCATMFAKAWSPERQKQGEEALIGYVRIPPTYEPNPDADAF